MGQFAIHVDTASGTAKANSNPVHGLNANVNFGQFDGLDTAAQSPTGEQFKGDTTGSEHKAPSTHANIAADTRNGAPSPQVLANVLGQAARAQAVMAGQQPGAMAGVDAKSMTPADAIQAVGAAAPAGPSQLSQTAKANPTTAAHQPEHPQTPAEQISVKIRQAVDEGPTRSISSSTRIPWPRRSAHRDSKRTAHHGDRPRGTPGNARAPAEGCARPRTRAARCRAARPMRRA